MARHRKASPTHRTRRRLTAMTLAVVGLAGLGLASAAQLNVTSGSLAAGTSVVASCQPADQPLSVSFTTLYDATSPAGYRATAVAVSNVRGCAGKAFQIQVTGTNGVALGTLVSGTVGTGTGPVTVGGSIGSVQVTQITGVAVVIRS